MQENLDKIKLVVALRSARTAVGWSQEEFAQRLGIAKTTIARMETLEGGLRADQLSLILRLYKSVGVTIDFMLGDDVTIRIDPAALRQAQARLENSEMRRSDRKKETIDSLGAIVQAKVAELRQQGMLPAEKNEQGKLPSITFKLADKDDV